MDLKRARGWRGVAVLLCGQVRDGTKPHVAQNVRQQVFRELDQAHVPYHIFAVLEYTRR